MRLFIPEAYYDGIRTATYTRSGDKSVRALSAEMQLRIKAALATYARTEGVDVKKLQGHGGYSLRIGDYRVLFDLTNETVEVYDAGARGGVY